jgi:hypothetical protein
VAQTSLDQVIAFLYPSRELSKARYVIIKLYIEGNEAEVLNEGGDFIKSKRATLFFENNYNQNEGSSPS